jgi:hypothetical protein
MRSHCADESPTAARPGRLPRPSQIAEVQAGGATSCAGRFLPRAAGLHASSRARRRSAILELPEHSKGLGQPVAARG